MRALLRVVVALATLALAWHTLAPAGPDASAAPSGPMHAFASCARVDVLVNPGPAGPVFVTEVRTALARVSRATGVRFRLAGLSDQVPSSAYLRQAAGPVLIGWAAPSQTDLLAPGASGGTSQALSSSGRVVSGAIALNAEHLGRYAAGFGPGATRGTLLLHELGHLIGLGHSQDPAALMFPVVSQDSPAGFASGERALLRQAYDGCRAHR